MSASRSLLVFALLISVGACSPAPPLPESAGHVGTPELRRALADTVLARTARRDAFSAVKNEALGLDPLAAMAKEREAVARASTDDALFYALSRMNHARRDSHLSLALVEGGLAPSDSAGLEHADGREWEPPEAAIKILPDYGDIDVNGARETGGWFVSDTAMGSGLDLPAATSKVLEVGGLDVDEWAARVKPYVRASSDANLRWRTAQMMTLETALLPPELRSDSLRLAVELPSGERAHFALPYEPAGQTTWAGLSEPNYPGFEKALETPTFELYLSEDGRPWVVLTWRGFRETMVSDVDRLMAFAEERGLLDHALVVDMTRSRGGSLGPYAVQRMVPRPFKTTFGNLRLSDVVPEFIAEKNDEFARNSVLDGTVPETIDDGSWLVDWLNLDVAESLERGNEYSTSVPFKLAHAPRESDGVLSPASTHFRGPLVVFSGPRRGSHLDQVIAIVTDNDLGYFIGMPSGGYSNTWEWEEVLTLPGIDQPVVRFMWNIGHTIRPNGEVLEGNPAQPDELVLLTRANALDYYPMLLARADAYLSALGHWESGS